MVRKIVGGLAGLGLIGGAGSVVYNDDGSAKVTIKDKQGHEQTVKLGGGNGRTFACPSGTEAKLEPIDIRTGRIKLTMKKIESQMDALDAKYPDHRAPGSVVTRYNGLLARDKRLTAAYNATVREHNAVLRADCD